MLVESQRLKCRRMIGPVGVAFKDAPINRHDIAVRDATERQYRIGRLASAFVEHERVDRAKRVCIATGALTVSVFAAHTR